MRRVCINAFALGASMVLFLNGPEQNSVILPHTGIIGADAALGSLKRVVGQGWRVGGRAMCAYFNRNYDSMKTLSYAKGKDVKERFESLSWEWLSVTDALSSHGDDNTLMARFEELKQDAKRFFDDLCGSTKTEEAQVPDFAYAPVDPFERQIADLRQRQEAQIQDMMAQVRAAQEREQAELERSVKEKREVAQHALQITNSVRVLINKSKSVLEQAQSALNDLPAAVVSIDKLVARIRQAIPSVQTMSADNYSPEVTNTLQTVKQEMDKNRDVISQILQNSENLINQGTNFLDTADDQAQSLFEFGAEARGTTEPLLTASARLRIYANELVEYVKSVLPTTEAKQLECRELHSKLEGALMLLSTKVWGVYSSKISEIESSLKHISSKEVLEVLNRSEGVLATIKSAIEHVQAHSTLSSEAQRNFEAVSDKVRAWQNDAAAVRSKMDYLADRFQEIKRLLSSLRSDSMTLDMSSLEKAFADAQHLQNALRRQKSLISTQINMLQVHTTTVIENAMKASGLYGLNPMAMHGAPGMGMGAGMGMGPGMGMGAGMGMGPGMGGPMGMGPGMGPGMGGPGMGGPMGMGPGMPGPNMGYNPNQGQPPF